MVVSTESPHAGLLKEIEKIPEFELLDVSTKRNEIHTGQPKFRGVVEKGKDDAIAIVSDKYALVQMKEIFGRVLSLIQEDIDGEVLYYRGRGQLHVSPKGLDVGLAVVNSVNATSAIKVYFIKKANGTNVYLPKVVYPDIKEYKRLHIGSPLNEVVNFNKMLLDVQETWGVIVDKLSKIPLTEDLTKEIKESLDTKTLVEVVDQFGNNLDKYTGGKRTLWDLLLVVLKTAAGSKFKSKIHQEKRLRQLSSLLLAFALKKS